MTNDKLFVDLSDDQAEKVVGGVGITTNGAGSSAGFFGWGTNPKSAERPTGLINAGFPGADAGDLTAGPNKIIVPFDMS